MKRRWQTSSVVLEDCSETVHHGWSQRLLECWCRGGRHQDREDVSFLVAPGRRHGGGRGHLLQVTGRLHLQVGEISHHSPLRPDLGHNLDRGRGDVQVAGGGGLGEPPLLFSVLGFSLGVFLVFLEYFIAVFLR